MIVSVRTKRAAIVLTVSILLLLTSGTLGYTVLEGWAWQDALFMTVITISTVGYGEVAPLSAQGQLFSILLITLGVAGAAYTLSVVTNYLVTGELRGILRRQRMVKNIGKLQNHYIICGYGRVGQQVVEGLRANRFDIVVIDTDPNLAEELETKGNYYIVGDASDDTILSQAGIERAGGLCACLPSDAANVFAILSARTLNPNLYIISRGNLEESERKLRIAGADQIINPYLITGHRMAAQLLHPGAVEFLDVIMRQGDLELRIEEILIGPGSDMSDKTLGNSHVREETGVNVLAVRLADGRLFTKLDANSILHEGDALVGLGTVGQLTTLASKAHDTRKRLHVASSL